MYKKFNRDNAMFNKRLEIEDSFKQKNAQAGGAFENLKIIHRLLRSLLNIFCLEQRGLQNLFDFNVIERQVDIALLPKVFDGFKILHLSDIHLDGIAGLTEKIITEISVLDYDMCVITGDFRFDKRTFHPDEMTATLELLDAINAPDGVWAVLGNHDCIEVAQTLEQHGVQVLLNEHKLIERQGQHLAITGVDDPHFYRCDDLSGSLHGVAENLINVLLVHSPEIVDEAVQADIDLYLCGHTHGGQIALPFGIPLFINARCKRRYASGAFTAGKMSGYTHRGTGASSVLARFNCRPEIVVHSLKKMK
ncbi:MAG: metallophosphoesterase [Colwellia sp.]|nr:metallophosphoesterase [Colwellia sp.]